MKDIVSGPINHSSGDDVHDSNAEFLYVFRRKTFLLSTCVKDTG